MIYFRVNHTLITTTKSTNEKYIKRRALQLSRRYLGQSVEIIRSVQEVCECDNTHQQNDTVCMPCFRSGRRRWNDPE